LPFRFLPGLKLFGGEKVIMPNLFSPASSAVGKLSILNSQPILPQYSSCPLFLASSETRHLKMKGDE